jgi:SPP1 family predicted phage head-tail adaptor
MALDAGTLRERVTVQQATENRNRLGEAISEWSTFAEVWASVNGVTAREYLLAGQQQIELSHRVKMRYLTGLTSKMRLSWRGRTLEIISILEHENRSIHELICQETV